MKPQKSSTSSNQIVTNYTFPKERLLHPTSLDPSIDTYQNLDLFDEIRFAILYKDEVKKFKQKLREVRDCFNRES